MDVANLITQADDAPYLGGLVDGLCDVDIESSALFQYVVERQLSDLGAHGGLRELGDGVLGIFDAVATYLSVGRTYRK